MPNLDLETRQHILVLRDKASFNHILWMTKKTQEDYESKYFLSMMELEIALEEAGIDTSKIEDIMDNEQLGLI